MDLKVAMNARGNVVAMWSGLEDEQGDYKLWFNYYTPSVGWGMAEVVQADYDRYGGVQDGSIQVVLDPHGNVVAVWQQDAAIWGNVYTPLGGWGTAEVLPGVIPAASGVRLDMNANGYAAAVWEQGGDIWMSFYRPPSETDGPYGRWVGKGAQGSGSNARVAVHPDEDILFAVWEDNGNVWSLRDPPLVSVGPQLLAPNAEDPHVVIDDEGNTIAVWRQYFAGVDRYDVYYSPYAPDFGAGTEWGNTQPVSSGSGSAERLRLAMDRAGNAVVVWFQEKDDGTGYDLWSSVYDPNELEPRDRWQEQELVQTDDGRVQSADVAMSAGSAVVVWSSRYNPIGISAWSRRYTPSQGWRAAPELVGIDGGTPDVPQVAMGAHGDAMVVWLDRPDVWSTWVR